MGVRRALLVVLAALFVAPTASASWLPHEAGAEWVYEWSDSAYSRAPAKEKVTVRTNSGRSFVLSWTTLEQGNAAEAPISVGNVAFQETTSGLINTDWSSTPPPLEFPILCGRLTGCNNSLASTYYLVIWGNRAPVLPEPLLKGTTWTSTGGADGDVTSISTYQGREQIVVPAFPEPVTAVKVRTDITQAGALGDPWGSGVRTVWWVYGVGPVKIVFQHAGGANAPVTTSTLMSTNRAPAALPGDANFFPLATGAKMRYRWWNSKHMKKPSVQEVAVAESVNNSARLDVKHVSGPIRVAGSYVFAARADGITNVSGFTRSASLAKFPPLGPRGLPANRRRHLVTPLDLLVYGLNPILTAYPKAGESWTVGAPSRDFSIFGVTGRTTVLGMRTVRVPAGRFSALAVRSTLRQAGFRYGSGTRTSYFAAGKGLVKLVFRHADGSTSTVELLG